MLAKNRNTLLSVLFISLAALACNLPSGATATEPPSTMDTETPTPTFTSGAPVSETPTPTAQSVETCKPTVTTNTNANVRSGPGQAYNIIGNIPQGGTATVAGKNFDGTWWYIEFAGGDSGHAWIAGSVTVATCIPDTLPSITAPPTPTVPTPTPTSTPTPTFTPTPTATSGGIIIVPPIFILPTPTPTLLIIFPIFTIGP
ncbi:MAG: SH3 domain-containing protein [Chloroflexi bacterium]|nr:SH3 domain-containing protein [Chloroflexota bacterium]